MGACSSKLSRQAGLLARGYQAVKRKIQSGSTFRFVEWRCSRNTIEWKILVDGCCTVEELMTMKAVFIRNFAQICAQIINFEWNMRGAETKFWLNEFCNSPLNGAFMAGGKFFELH